MYLGEVVEIGRTEEIFKNPKHPYTKALLSSVPELNPQDEKERIHLQGELPSPENLPTGCKFHTRCPYVMEICKTSTPQVKEFSDTHNCKCFYITSKIIFRGFIDCTMAIRIDHIKTHLPLSKIKGTPQARLNQAIKMSDNFLKM